MELTIGRFLKFIVVLFILAVIGWLIYSLSTIITFLIISILIAYILDPVAGYLESRGLSRTFSTLIVFISIFGIIGLAGAFIMPALIAELQTLQQNISAGGLENTIRIFESKLAENFSFFNPDEIELKEKAVTLLNDLTSQALNFAANVFSLLYALIIIPFITFFLLKDGRNIKKAFISYVPNKYFEMVLNLIHKIDNEIGGFLRGQFIEAFVVGLLATIALSILNIKYAFVIGIFAGLANFIPYVGPFAGATAAILTAVANGHDLTMVTYIIAAFLIIQLNDNVIMQPWVLSKSVNLHPLIIILAVLIGGQFFGVLGMFLAVPASGIIKVTSKEIYNSFIKFRMV